MADTGCEDLILVTVGDRGRLLDVSRLDLSLVHFVMRCKQLIVDRVAVTSKVTYTGILMNMLAKEPVVFRVGNVWNFVFKLSH